MEVLACSGARHARESDCPEQGSETASKHDGKSDCVQDAEQVRTNLKVDDLTLDIGESHEVREEGGQFISDGFPASEGGSNGDTYYEFDVDGQNLSCYSHDSEDDNLDKRDHFAEAGLALEGSHLVLGTIESGLPNNKEGSSHSEIKGLERDEPQAVWVKWRGKWQSGIRCARADWPLPTLKAKPTHDRKQYLVIFFPRTRNYSWADVLLVRPINEFPQPIAYKTHKVGVKMVKDLTLARRFIMQKLAVSMLNVLDQLNREMILRRCLTSDWLHQSMHSWKQRCEDANSAECIEMLKEFSHPISTAVGSDQPINDSPLTMGLQMTRKRPKLEIRRAEYTCI
ncbi:Histone-lysine N-methyltransferase SUVR5 [Sesamum angolense]|uniref:Histone-lysine N-methyltransferase SUVR5 n=1 Tax=Sesamum angolense TaxID=2727404 RepID=A0AAE1WHE9_9LAMI|nr:Histone-lysine N-methyltransferase SUVR5 [Sesamum angolense]